MGIIKKKTAVRGTEGGVKYICDICSADITSTVRIRCAHQACKEYDLCVPCFSEGKSTRDHDPPTHPYSVIEQHSIPIFTDDWGADEETLLLEGAETYGLGSWADIADHIGGYRDKDEVRDHYINSYINSPNFPLPEHASPADTALTQEWPRDKFLARKKRRIEDRKEEIKNAPPAAPKTKPTSSVPSCHEVQGYMPGRLEFEHEHFNEAEEGVQHMQFDPGEGDGPEQASAGANAAPDEVNLKMTIMHIYNARLTARVERKKIIFEHQLLECRKNMAVDKKRSKEERDLNNKAKPFARLMTHQDFEDFTRDLEYELNLRQAIAQLQEWRQMSIGDLKAGDKYEQEKSARAARAVTLGTFDRFASNSRVAKPVPPVEIPAAVTTLTGPELVLRPVDGHITPPPSLSPQAFAGFPEDKKPLATGTGNAAVIQQQQRPKFVMQPPPNVAPLKLSNDNAPDLQLLSHEEAEVCSTLRLMPKPYNVMKDSVLREAQRHGGLLKKKTVREICRIDSTKGGKLFDFWVYCGWIGKA